MMTREELATRRYPVKEGSASLYFVFSVTDDIENIWSNYQWNVSMISGYQGFRQSANPFSGSLTELMKAKL